MNTITQTAMALRASLDAGAAFLGSGQIDFAASLCAQALQGKKKLSEKQAEWLYKLHDKAITPPAPAKTVNLGISMLGMISLFDSVADKLKYPKIRLQVVGEPLAVSRSNGGKYPGSINVTDGKPFGENKWYGRILPNGEWMPSFKADELPMLEDFLTQFAQNPAGMAAEYGKLTGHCCFCAKKLTQEESTTAGYGQTCAKKWGLPWTKKEMGAAR